MASHKASQWETTTRPQVPTAVSFSILPDQKGLKQIFHFHVLLGSLCNLDYLCFLIAGTSQPPLCVCLSVCLCACLSASWRPCFQTHPDLEGSRVGEGQDNGRGRCRLASSGEQPTLICWGRPATQRENSLAVAGAISGGGVSNLDSKAMFLHVRWTGQENQLGNLYKMQSARPHLQTSTENIHPR